MKKLFELLKERSLTFGSVESMTGGMFASLVTSTPGASKVYKGSLVTYQVEEKVRLLGMDKDFIEKYDVVSEEVAKEMAKLGREKLDVDIAISITGNAGPTAEPGKANVGTFFVGIASKNDVICKKFEILGKRNKIRNKATLAMQDELIKYLLNK